MSAGRPYDGKRDCECHSCGRPLARGYRDKLCTRCRREPDADDVPAGLDLLGRARYRADRAKQQARDAGR